MFTSVFHTAFIGPGGPELLVVMLVLIIMFGAKDAPKMFRRINDILTKMRDTADGFKREIMYGDLMAEPTAAQSSADDDGYDFDDAEDDHDDGSETAADERRGGTKDTIADPEEDLKKADAESVEPNADEGDDAQKA